MPRPPLRLPAQPSPLASYPAIRLPIDYSQFQRLFHVGTDEVVIHRVRQRRVRLNVGDKQKDVDVYNYLEYTTGLLTRDMLYPWSPKTIQSKTVDQAFLP